MFSVIEFVNRARRARGLSCLGELQLKACYRLSAIMCALARTNETIAPAAPCRPER
jgi:hypothetical protein